MDLILKKLNIGEYWKDPLYRNSFFLMLTSLSNAGFGFIFWLLAANYYSQQDVGIATAIISSISVIILLSRYGFDQTMVRYFPFSERGKVFATTLIVTTIITFILGLIFIFGIDFWSPELSVIKGYSAIYIFLLIVCSTVTITGVYFIAIRKSEIYLIQSILMGSRVLFLLPLVYLGIFGIVMSYGFSLILALLLLIIPLVKLGITNFHFDLSFLKESFHFSVANYISGLLIVVSAQILPIIVLNVLGPEATAQYFITYSIASILFMIPTSIGLSLFVEGSHGENLEKNVRKSILAVILLLIPAIIIISLYGVNLLSLFGKSYIQNQFLLIVMCCSSLFVGPVYIYISIKKIQKDLKKLMYISILIFILQIGLSYTLMKSVGIIGIGYAWLSSYGIGVIIILLYEKLNNR